MPLLDEERRRGIWNERQGPVRLRFSLYQGTKLPVLSGASYPCHAVRRLTCRQTLCQCKSLAASAIRSFPGAYIHKDRRRPKALVFRKSGIAQSRGKVVGVIVMRRHFDAAAEGANSLLEVGLCEKSLLCAVMYRRVRLQGVKLFVGL